MSPLLGKRIGLIVISLVLGFIITWAEVTSDWSIGGRQFGLGTTLDDYGQVYTFLTVLCFALGFACVLDKFMGTEILPE